MLAASLLAAGSVAGLRNILFIAVDDLRPEASAYGHEYMKTPNIDALAKESTLFQRAYVQYSFCAPSRNSFMTGRRPDRTQCWSFTNHFRQVGPEWVSMPQYFRENGYFTVGTGKLYHKGLPPSFDAPKSWDHFTYSGDCNGTTNGYPVLEPNVTNVKCPPATTNCKHPGELEGKADFCALNTSQLEYPLEDEITVQTAWDYMTQAKASGKPFFLGVGFHKPHLPWYYPIEFNDTYPPADQIALAEHPDVPSGMPKCAWHEAGFGEKWNKSAPADMARAYRRAYYSAVSYTDYNIGRVLKRLKDLELDGNTTVAMMGDHGWQLGEMNLWKKMTNFELGVRVPLIIRAPWITTSVGATTAAFAEAVDLYPTFVELSGLPPVPASEGLEGSSLVGVLQAPGEEGKDYAFSQFAKQNVKSTELHKTEAWGVCTECSHSDIDVMGYSIRSDNWRYTEWVGWDKEKLLPQWTTVKGVELYNHTGDYGTSIDRATPTVNLHKDPSLESVVTKLQGALHQHFNNDR
eukprot:Hpha_TRINITY_DN15963_c0_g5::TRINITY_DN15963_c0_g5_i1::g.74487::m.74487/K01136/IDS; iduronate 2-sulfatase